MVRVNVLDGCRGSSPLTRGKRSRQHRSLFMARLIPAHAGKTVEGVLDEPEGRAHPRSRGENVAGDYVLVDEPGSSPLTRGKLRATHRVGRVPGLIPAHAGKTTTARQLAKRAGGSSPLTRGKRVCRVATRRPGGLIPAHAGKTKGKAIVSFDAGAHPRSRGENLKFLVSATTETGSSPLTRGKRPQSSRAERPCGLIPAHAGKTSKDVIGSPVLRAHPRSRGENVLAAPMIVLIWGSSPLTRGKRSICAIAIARCGLIPAHAGKTPKPKKHCVPGRAHPRSRGEN